jgi:hypothetical protein
MCLRFVLLLLFCLSLVRSCGQGPPLWSADPEVRERFLALTDFLRNSGSGMESITEKIIGRNSRGSGLESREYGRGDPSR